MKIRKIRAAALLAVFGVLAGLVAGGLRLPVEAAPKSGSYDNFKVTNASGGPVKVINPTNGTKLTIQFDYIETAPPPKPAVDKIYTASQFSVNSTVWSNSGATLKFKCLERLADGSWRMEATVSGLVYRNSGRSSLLELSSVRAANGSDNYNTLDPDKFSVSLPSTWFTQSSSSTDPDSDIGYTSDIIIENVIVTDASGNRLDTVSKSTPAFTVEIVYIDNGLIDLDVDDSDEAALNAYARDFGGFISTRGTRGTLLRGTRTSDGAPRFRVKFTGLTWDGTGNTITFIPIYDIYGEQVQGDATAAKVFQARADAGDDDIEPATPYIIVSQYSYGGEQIQAGSSFTLDITCRNTSKTLPLENIVITFTAPEHLSIASASNTVYIDSLAAGDTLRHTLNLAVLPNAPVGSHGVKIDFSYQYIANKERKENKTTESIAIPIAQIDRFTVDPLTEVPEAAMVEQEFYIEVPFINKGRSAVYNISASAVANLQIVSPSQHYDGTLEAGKSDTLEVAITAKEAGDLQGEIVVQYEDENTNQKEIRIPFSIYIEPARTPEPPMPPDGGQEMQQDTGTSLATILLCVFGGLCIAAPIALYIVKRLRAKGNEEFDEDF